MNPSITIFGIEIASYFLMTGIGIAASFAFVVLMAKSEKQSIHDVIPIYLFIVIGVMIGGKILYAIVNIDRLFVTIEEYRAVGDFNLLVGGISRLFSGQVFYGGLYGGFLGLYVYTRLAKLNTAYYIWLATPGIALFSVFGRTGCFLTGCCYGVPLANSSFSLLMNGGDVARVPTQLIEVCFNILLFTVLVILQRKDIFKKHLFKIYLLIYSVYRFIIEFWRGDIYRGVYGDIISTSQIIALITIAAVSILYIKDYLKLKNTA